MLFLVNSEFGYEYLATVYNQSAVEQRSHQRN